MGEGDEVVFAVLKENPDLIVLDMQMPIVNGLQALTILRKNSRFDSTPILINRMPRHPRRAWTSRGQPQGLDGFICQA